MNIVPLLELAQMVPSVYQNVRSEKKNASPSTYKGINRVVMHPRQELGGRGGGRKSWFGGVDQLSIKINMEEGVQNHMGDLEINININIKKHTPNKLFPDLGESQNQDYYPLLSTIQYSGTCACWCTPK